MVHLYSRPCGPIIASSLAHHWCLEFRWNGGYNATFEGLRSPNGILYPEFKKGRIDKTVFNWSKVSKHRARRCSPKEVCEKVCEIYPENLPYDFLRRNCHELARDLSKEFGVQLPAGNAALARTVIDFSTQH